MYEQPRPGVNLQWAGGTTIGLRVTFGYMAAEQVSALSAHTASEPATVA